MALFVSYSRLDKEVVDELIKTVRLIDEQVWFDEHLAAGQEWWSEILKRIRECDVFFFALSKNSQNSRHCQAELGYARKLGRHILPVTVGSVDNKRVNPVADLQAIDYVKSGFMRVFNSASGWSDFSVRLPRCRRRCRRTRTCPITISGTSRLRSRIDSSTRTSWPCWYLGLIPHLSVTATIPSHAGTSPIC